MKSFFLPIILILIAIGLGYFVILDQYDVYKEKSSQIAEVQESIDQYQNLKQEIDKKSLKISAISDEDKNRLGILLPDSVDTVKLVAQITDNLAKKNGIVIRKIEIKKSTETTVPGQALGAAEGIPGGIQPIQTGQVSLKSLGMSFKFRTTYTKAISFLKDLEKSLQLIDVESLKIGGANSASAGSAGTSDSKLSGQYDFDVSAKTYSFE